MRDSQMSRHDQYLRQREMVDDLDTRSTQEREYAEAVQEINTVIKQYTSWLYVPLLNDVSEYALNFEQMRSKVSDTERIFEEISGKEMSSNDRAFIAGAIIRYIDDFLDELFWGYVRHHADMDPKYPNLKEEFKKRYIKMIRALYEVAKKYDPWMPESIMELPILEMEFEMNPTQEFFDEHITEYIDRKAYDLMYLHHVLSQGDRTGHLEFVDEDSLQEYRVFAMFDVQRDISNDGDSYDFDIFRHIRVYDLDPEVFRQVVARILSEGEDKIKNKHVLHKVQDALAYIETM
jgi:hypothetical protein